MKVFYKILPLIMFIVSCQKERLILEGNESSLNQDNTTLFSYANSMATNDTTSDDFIDNNPCTYIELPATFLIEDTPITITKTADYQQIINLLQISSSDDLEIQYPINLIDKEGNKTIITSKSDLSYQSKNCSIGNTSSHGNNTGSIDFEYPLTLYIFNKYSKTSQIVDVKDKKQLKQLLNVLSRGTVVDFKYPITLIYKDGSSVEINDIDSFSEIMKKVYGDSEDDLFYEIESKTELQEEILEKCGGIWRIAMANKGHRFIESNNVVFDFSESEDGIVSVIDTHSNTTSVGDVSFQLSTEGEYILNIDIENYPEFSGSWSVFSINNILSESKNSKIIFKSKIDNRIMRIRSSCP